MDTVPTADSKPTVDLPTDAGSEVPAVPEVGSVPAVPGVGAVSAGPGDEATAGVVAATRPSRRPRDLVLSLLVLLLPIALLTGVYRVLYNGDEPVVTDAAPVLAQARTAGDFPVAEPARLGDGWRTVSARYVPGDGQAVLRIGYLSPSGAGFQLIESDRPAEALLAEELTTAARPRGVQRIGSRDWQEYQGRPGERALVLLEPERTLLVIGAGGQKELAALAAALAP